MSESSAKRKRDNADVVDSGPTKIAKPTLPSTPEKFPTSQAYDTIVRIKTDTCASEKVFDVHKGILCFYSGYFRAAFNGKWKEAQDGAIDMPSIESTVFEAFTHWAYSRRLEMACEEGNSADYSLLFELWVFGDAHQIPLLQNEVVTTLHRALSQNDGIPGPALVTWVYEHTMPQSQLRRLLIDVWAARCSGTTLKDCTTVEGWCKDALFDLLQTVWREGWRFQGRKGVEKWDLCEYHVHEQGVRCNGSSPA